MSIKHLLAFEWFNWEQQKIYNKSEMQMQMSLDFEKKIVLQLGEQFIL